MPELKKPEKNEEIIEEIEEIDETPPKPEPKKVASPKKPINIMDSSDSNEPPKPKKDTAPAVDLSPVIDEIQKGFASLAPKAEPPPKKEAKKVDEDFLAPLGDW